MTEGDTTFQELFLNPLHEAISCSFVSYVSYN